MRYNIKPDSFAKLKRNHLLFGAIYLLFGLFTFVGSFTIQALKNFKPELYIDIFKRMQRTTGPSPRPYYLTGDIPAEYIKDIPFMLIIGIILLISAVIHISIVNKRFNAAYNSNLQNGVAKPRYVDGMFSSVLLPLIALMMGVNDVVSILLIFVLAITFPLLALSMEEANSQKTKTSWTGYIGMVLIFVVSASVLIITMLKHQEIQQVLLDNLTISAPYLKPFNYTVMFVYFGFWFIKLMHTMLTNLKVRAWKNPAFVENIHITINLLMKLAVIGMIFYGLVNKLFTIFYVNL